MEMAISRIRRDLQPITEHEIIREMQIEYKNKICEIITDAMMIGSLKITPIQSRFIRKCHKSKRPLPVAYLKILRIIVNRIDKVRR